MSNLLSFLKDNFEKFDTNKKIYNLRKEAFDKFNNIGIPTRKHEDWKYLNLAFLSKLNYKYSNENNVNKNQIEEQLIPNLSENLIVLVNGFFDKNLSKFIDTNFEVLDLNTIIDNDEYIHYFQNNLISNNPLHLINTAFLENGILIKVSKNTEIKNPIHILNVFNNEEETLFVNSKNIIVAEENSNVKIIQSYHNLRKSSYILNTSSDFYIDKNSKVYHYNFQNDDENSVIFSCNQAQQKKDSTFSDNTITLGGKLIRNELKSQLQEENSETYYNGLYLIDGNTVVDNHTLVDHIAPRCHSNEFYKGIIDDNAKAIFNGKVYVHQEAQKTDAYQQNRNLVISDNAAIYTKPELEIYADDVKCSHGATTGKIDKSQLFYMMQRGISKERAKALLMYTFCAEIISRIDVEEMKIYIENLVLKRLNIELEKIDI